MERSEPTLVPEWLKNSGNPNGGATVSRSDDQTYSKLARNKSFVSNNNNGHDLGQSFSSDRTTSSYFRRSSSSNGSSHLSFHSNFGRNKHNRDWEKDTFDFRDKEKSVLSSKYDSGGLRHSHPAGYGKHSGMWHKRDVTKPSGNNINGIVTNVSPTGKNIMFERDFPSFGAEDRTLSSETGRVSSLTLNSSASGEKWTSALAEVPVLVGSNGTGILSAGLGSGTSLNMVEAVTQGHNRTQSTAQPRVEIQRREELAIKQSRQLIPVIPSLPKTLALNSSDKLKNKAGHLHQQPSSSSVAANHTPRGGPAKSEVSRQSNMGKLHFLKPMHEKNGATLALKDNSSPTNSTVTTKGPVNSPIPDHKPVLTVLKKKPTSQALSRNDFFNSVRRQSTASTSQVAVPPQIDDDDNSSGLSPSEARLSEVESDSPTHVINGKKDFKCNIVFSEEEEAEFLKSMGWEENSEEGCLTEEEISSFFRDVDKYKKPFLKILQLQLLPTFKTQIGGVSS